MIWKFHTDGISVVCFVSFVLHSGLSFATSWYFFLPLCRCFVLFCFFQWFVDSAYLQPHFTWTRWLTLAAWYSLFTFRFTIFTFVVDFLNVGNDNGNGPHKRYASNVHTPHSRKFIYECMWIVSRFSQEFSCTFQSAFGSLWYCKLQLNYIAIAISKFMYVFFHIGSSLLLILRALAFLCQPNPLKCTSNQTRFYFTR